MLDRVDTRQLPKGYMNRYQCNYYDHDIEDKEFETFDTKKRGWSKKVFKLKGFASEKEIIDVSKGSGNQSSKIQKSSFNIGLNKRLEKLDRKNKENIGFLSNQNKVSNYPKGKTQKDDPSQYKHKMCYIDLESFSKVETKRQKIFEEKSKI